MDDGDQAPPLVAKAPSVSSSAPPPPVPASLASSLHPPPALPPKEPKEEAPAPLPSRGAPRFRFSVELKAGETTIVSWKRLLRESGKGSASPSRTPAEAVGGPAALVEEVGPSGASVDVEPNDGVPHPSRFSAVIEKIERLYMGKHSSDEEDLDDIPDDDQYDTEDSFIDDAELDEYFQIDKLATKHEGYFVNKGKLEHIEISSSPKEVMRKRRRKDQTELQGEFGGGHTLNKSAHVSNMQIKDAARGTPQVGRKLSHPVNVLIPSGEHGYEKGRNLKHKSTASLGMHRKRSDFSIKPELSPAVRPVNKDFTSPPIETKDFDKHKAGHLAPRDIAYKSKRAGDSFDPVYQQSSYKGQIECQSKKLQNAKFEDISTKVRRKENYVTGEFSGANSLGPAFPMQSAHHNSIRVKEGSSIRPKGTTLERAIRDLEKIVAECRPASLDVQDVDPSFQGVKRRLPREVKQKLAKVARLSANQGKILKDELMDRLMGILGHLVQRRTLKRNMKEMVELGISEKQEKADKYQQIKKEVNEMIRVRVSQLKAKLGEQQQDGSTDAFQESIGNGEKKTLKGRYTMDAALEDRICDLYDLFVEGMDEDKGPRSRKLYIELAELWPTGYMDNIGIKNAIYRSKERRRIFYSQNRVRDAERIKRKKLAATRSAESNPVSQLRAFQERSLFDAGQALTADKLASNQLAASTSRFMDPTLPSESLQQGSKNPDKIRAGSMSAIPGEASKSFVDSKKKMKRKSEVDSGEIHAHSSKVYSQNVPEKHKFPKYVEETVVSHHPNSNPEQLPDLPGSVQPS